MAVIDPGALPVRFRALDGTSFRCTAVKLGRGGPSGKPLAAPASRWFQKVVPIPIMALPHPQRDLTLAPDHVRIELNKNIKVT
jgi:hypothetical protein